MTKPDMRIALLGNLAEYYNVTLYGFLAFHFAELYFPADNKLTSLMASFMTFAAGYFMRPLGSIIMGYICDTKGSSVAVYYSLLLGSLPAIIIALLPTYEAIGIWAPAILIMLRMLQGISISGEWSSLVVYILDNTPKEKSNFWSSVISSTGFLGCLIAALAAGLSKWSALPDYTWRLAFFMGGLLSIYTTYWRYRLNRPKRKVTAKRLQKNKRNIFLDMFVRHRYSLLAASLIGATSGGSFYLGWLYVGNIYVDNFFVDQQLSAFIGFAYMLLWVVALPIVGYFADSFKLKSTIWYSLVGITLLSYPSFLLIHSNTILYVVLGQILLVIPNLGIVACTNSFLFRIFPEKQKCMALGFGYTIGVTFFGAMMPTFILLMTQYIEKQTATPLYLSVFSLLALVVSSSLLEEANKPLKRRRVHEKDFDKILA